MLCVNNWLHGKSEVRHQREKKRCVGSCSEGRGRADQWVIEHVGEGCQTVTPTQLHRTVSTGLNSWEQSRSPSCCCCCCCCVLLQKPHMEPHVTASTTRRIYTGGAQRAHELLLHGWHNRGQDENRNTLFFPHPQTTVEWTLEHERRRDKYVSRSLSWNMLFLCSCCNTGARLCVRKKGHRSALANVDKGFIVEGGECQTNHTAAGLLEPALLTCSDRQDQENVVVQSTLHSGLQLDSLLQQTVKVILHGWSFAGIHHSYKKKSNTVNAKSYESYSWTVTTKFN